MAISRHFNAGESRSQAIRLLCDARATALRRILNADYEDVNFRATWPRPYDAADYALRTCTNAIQALLREG